MAIPDGARKNFDTLLRAARDGNLALIDCLDAMTRKPRYVLCAIGRSNGECVMTPFSHLASGNPYDAYLPPGVDDPAGLIASHPNSSPTELQSAIGQRLTADRVSSCRSSAHSLGRLFCP
jgi:hypothetical protein